MAKDVTLAELQKQIELLQAQAQTIIQAEKAGVIEELKAKISQYGITFKELGFKAPEPSIAPSADTEKGKNTGKGTAPLVAMYRNKTNEAETWHGGKGAYPKWIYENIIDTVLDKEKGVNGKVAKEKVIKYLDDNGYKIEVKEEVVK